MQVALSRLRLVAGHTAAPVASATATAIASGSRNQTKRAIASTRRSMATGKITDWADKSSGAFHRQESAFRRRISSEPNAEFPPVAGRYHLYVSYACPWAHRTLIVRKLKGLEDLIDYTVVHWYLGEEGWRFVTPSEQLPGENVRPDPLAPEHTHLRELYHATDPGYSGRFTVPVLWDTVTKQIVSNESADIIRMFYNVFDKLLPRESAALNLLPSELEKAVDEANAWIYPNINNGVYRCGFATTREAYADAVPRLFDALDRVEAHLRTRIATPEPDLAQGTGPYWFGAQLTEVDVRLYTTIVRFDPVYVQHFKCNRRDIRSGYPALHLWLRRLYWGSHFSKTSGTADTSKTKSLADTSSSATNNNSTEPTSGVSPDRLAAAFRATTDFEHIKKHYTQSHKHINPYGITPDGPVPNILRLDEEVPAVQFALDQARQSR